LPRQIRVAAAPPADFATIRAAIDAASLGDTVLVSPGVYTEQIRLRDGIGVISERPGAAVIQYPPDAPPGTAVAAQDVNGARLYGFRILGQPNGLLEVGVALDNAAVELQDLEIAGARMAGLVVSGAASPTVRASRIHSNGTGVVVRGGAAPWLAHNMIIRNGRAPGEAGPGIELEEGAGAVLTGNVIADNGAEGVSGVSATDRNAIVAANVFVADGRANGGGPVRLLGSPAPPLDRFPDRSPAPPGSRFPVPGSRPLAPGPRSPIR
jgi:hypothetical protein